MFIFTLDLVTRKYPIIVAVDNLPYDCTALLPCPPSLGGVMILSGNAIISVDQSSRRVALAMSGWAGRVSDIPLQPLRADEESRQLQLEGAQLAFVDDRTLFAVLKDGSVYPVEIVMDGKMVSKLSMGTALAQTTIPATIRDVGDGRLFIGSTVGPSVLLKTAQFEEEVPRDPDQESLPAAVVDPPLAMEIDDEDGKSGCVSDRSHSLTIWQTYTAML